MLTAVHAAWVSGLSLRTPGRPTAANVPQVIAVQAVVACRITNGPGVRQGVEGVLHSAKAQLSCRTG